MQLINLHSDETFEYMKHLSINDLYSYAQVNKKFSENVRSQRFWQRYFKFQYNFKVNSLLDFKKLVAWLTIRDRLNKKFKLYSNYELKYKNYFVYELEFDADKIGLKYRNISGCYMESINFKLSYIIADKKNYFILVTDALFNNKNFLNLEKELRRFIYFNQKICQDLLDLNF